MSEPEQRIPQISEHQRSDEARAMFAAMAGVGAVDVEQNHVLKTFAQYPDLTRPFLQFNRHLLTTSVLPVRLRQLAILRVAWTRKARYMWASHIRTSIRLGLGSEDFQSVKAGPDAACWSDAERATLGAVDQLIDRSDLDDAHWAALATHLDPRQMMDFVFTVGTYTMLAMVLTSWRVQREPDLLALSRLHGTPEDA